MARPRADHGLRGVTPSVYEVPDGKTMQRE